MPSLTKTSKEIPTQLLLYRALLLFALLAVWSPRAPGQIATTIRGQVVDAEKAAVKDASVELLQHAKLVASQKTNSDGFFEFRNVPVGEYDIKVSAKGFVSQTLVNYPTHVGSESAIQVTLQVDRSVTVGEFTSPGPQWNLWLEQFSSSVQFRPLPKLLTNKVYLLTVDLSGIALGGHPGVYTSAISPDLADALEKDGRDELPLGVLALPDETYFEPQSDNERFKYLPINYKKIRAARDQRFSIPAETLEYMKRNPDGPLSYGRKTFLVKTRDKAGQTSIVLSFWVDGQMPVDEASLPVCIVNSPSDSCVASNSPVFGFRGLDSVRTAAQGGRFSYPDAALHFVELDSENVVGIFKCNSCAPGPSQKFLTWRLGRSANWLSKYLSETLLTDFENSHDRATYFRRGQELFFVLFHGSDSGQGLQARRAFLEFVSNPTRPLIPAPSIFVRILPEQKDPLFLVPLGLMVPSGSADFLGFHFRIETPLEIQDYVTPAQCISKWVLLVPSEQTQDDALQAARAALLPWIVDFEKWTQHASVFEALGSFQTWVADDEEKARTEQSAILILSHHANNKLYLDSETDTLESVEVARKMDRPSVVFLNACGTGKPGAWEFVREFNDKGASAAVATSITVDGRMAGLFMSEIAKNLRVHSGEQYSLGQAKFEAAIAVSKMPLPPPEESQTYGPQALIYMLAGNGGLKVCAPADSTRTQPHR